GGDGTGTGAGTGTGTGAGSGAGGFPGGTGTGAGGQGGQGGNGTEGQGGYGGGSGDGAGGDGSEGPGGYGGGDGQGGLPGEGPGGTGTLEDVFERSLGDFDGMIAGEQEDVSQVQRDTGSFGGEDDGRVVGLGKQGQGTRTQGGIIVANDGGGGGSGDGAGDVSSVEAIPDEILAERTPDDIPDPVYDDIVSRQLREAALAEEDPVIREKLWDEYRKYTGIN
ncbi:MAG: hypothetical protein AAFV30_02000, partial [Pseudomonadota bacterium]